MILKQTRQLSNGVEIPVLGYGTSLLPETEAAQLVKCAARYGYRLFDIDQANSNLTAVGEGIQQGGVPRDELFISVRLDTGIRTAEETAKALRDSADSLGTGTIDLVLIDMPEPEGEDAGQERRSAHECLELWSVLEKALADGTVRAIGVSNFEQKDVDALLERCSVHPMVNQVRCGVSETPEEVLSYCREHSIAVMSYSPLGHGHLLKDRELKSMAEEYGATTAQLCIRYAIQIGTIPVPRALKEKYIRENSEVEFDISPEDMETLRAMHRR